MATSLDNFGKLTAAGSVVLLALAMTHEWAYFSIIGFHFLSLFSAYDYLLTTLSWLPSLLVIWLAMGLFQLLSSPQGQVAPLAGRGLLHFIGAISFLGAVLNFFISPLVGSNSTFFNCGRVPLVAYCE
jgi:hypothetical protein